MRHPTKRQVGRVRTPRVTMIERKLDAVNIQSDFYSYSFSCFLYLSAARPMRQASECRIVVTFAPIDKLHSGWGSIGNGTKSQLFQMQFLTFSLLVLCAFLCLHRI
jgi:hypothetical protein